MADSITINGVARDIDSEWVTINGVYREVDSSFVTIGGVYREAFTSGPPPIILISGSVSSGIMYYEGSNSHYYWSGTSFTPAQISQLKAQGYTKIIGHFTGSLDCEYGMGTGSVDLVAMFAGNNLAPGHPWGSDEEPFYFINDRNYLPSYGSVHKTYSGDFELPLDVIPRYDPDYSNAMQLQAAPIGSYGDTYPRATVTVSDVQII